jgi:hypothetical protein
VLDRASGAGIEPSAGPLLSGLLDDRLQGFGGLGLQRDHAFGVALADRDPQPWMPGGVGVEAVDGEAADPVSAGAAAAHDNQRSSLVGVGK